MVIKIAKELQIPRRTAYDWINKYGNCDKEQMLDKQTGRSKMSVDRKTRRYIIRFISKILKRRKTSAFI